MIRRERLLPLGAAALFLASLAFPYWTVTMSAPTYPERALTLHLYAYKYEGDVDEWNRVGRLVGVRVPPPIPEQTFVALPAAVVVASGLALATMASRRLLAVAAVFPWLLLTGLAAWGQYTLYLFGHSLDPDRPLRYFDEFTPPIIGVLTLGKIQTFHFPNLGSALFILAGLLLALAAWRAASGQGRPPLRPPARRARREVAVSWW